MNSRGLLSVNVNTYNEAHLIKECVESVRGLAQEIIVTDMGSTDGSAELAASLGCRVIPQPKMPSPESGARAVAVKESKGPWILVLDPDMRVPEATARRLDGFMEQDEGDMVDFSLLNYFLGKPCPHGHGSQPIFRKMFKKSCFSPVGSDPHTFWHQSLQGRPVKLGKEFPIIHLGYQTFNQAYETLVRYARKEAKDRLSEGLRPSLFRSVWRPWKRFMGNYFLRLGFLDGTAGLILSSLISFNLWLVETFMWEAARQEKP